LFLKYFYYLCNLINNQEMVKFKFQLDVGFVLRNQTKIELERSKDTLEYTFSGSNVSIREEKSFLSSIFYIQGTNFPDTKEFESVIREWYDKIENY